MPALELMGRVGRDAGVGSSEDRLFHISPKKIKALNSNSKVTSIQDFSQ